jgi:hypothetical protein
VAFIGEESSKSCVNAYIPKYISRAYYIMFLWRPGRDGTRSKVTENVFVITLHAFHRFNRHLVINKVNFQILRATYIRFSSFCFVMLVHTSATYADIVSHFAFLFVFGRYKG